MSSAPLCVVGGGAFATTLAATLGRGGRRVVLFHPEDAVASDLRSKRRGRYTPGGVELPSLVRVTSEAEAATQCPLLLFACRPDHILSWLPQLAPHLDGAHSVLHGSAAFLPGGVSISQFVREQSAVRKVGVIAGPAMAGDLAAGRPCAIVVASSFRQLQESAAQSLALRPALRVYCSDEVLGVELAAASSDALTIALGMLDGLGLGDGPRAVLITRAVAEMQRLGSAFGAAPECASGLAGLGNLLIRGQGQGRQYSENYILGGELVKGNYPGEPLPQGARTAQILSQLAASKGIDCPILKAVCMVVAKEATVAQIAEGLAGKQGRQHSEG